MPHDPEPPAASVSAALTQTADFQRGLQAGAALFNGGHWWEAHEAWEAVWMRETGERRQFVQALILLAAALHKRWAHGSLAHRNFDKAEKYLDALPDEYGGINLRRLRQEVWAALNTEGPDIPGLPQIPWTLPDSQSESPKESPTDSPKDPPKKVSPNQ